MPSPSSRPCVVFDFDGTLADTLDAIVIAVNDTLVQFGHPARPKDHICDHMGRGLRPLYTWATGIDDMAAIAAVVDATRARYSEVWRAHTRIFPGIPELLAELRARGAAVCVLSNKGHDATMEAAEGMFPAGTFDAIHGIAPDWPGKPDPQGLLRMIASVGSTPAGALMVGDMSVDVRVGRAASVRTIGVTWGFQGIAAFDEDSPDHLAATPAAILDLYEASLSG
jgi:phosphoglycolate phosphatase